MNLKLPDNFQSVRVRFTVNGYDVDVFTVPTYRSVPHPTERGKTQRVPDGHTWNALIIHPLSIADRHELVGLDTYSAACWGANEKTKELASCPRKARETVSPDHTRVPAST
jgi:hypothetical protein